MSEAPTPSGLYLGIETSCDETAAAVVRADGFVLSDVVHSQVELHAPFGGIVPEVAARDHASRVLPVVTEALARADVPLRALDAVVATTRPGLSPALVVGAQLAKGLAWGAARPFVGVDHLVGHMCSALLWSDGEQVPRVPLPLLCLLVSGGHTALYRVDDFSEESVRELAGTRDDAAGEAFDKVAKLLGLGYPGGPRIDALAARGHASAAAHWTKRKGSSVELERSGELSFSGLKSSFARRIEAEGAPTSEPELADVCAAFQRDVVETLLRRTLWFCEREGLTHVLVAGGVAANRGLRARFGEVLAARGIGLTVPAPRRCTDNAAMIALAGARSLERTAPNSLSLAVESRTRMLRATRKGRGARGASTP